VAYAVSRRTQEIGVRMAIGASAGRVFGMVLRQGLAPVWAGLAGGVILSGLAQQWLPGLMPLRHPLRASALVWLVPVLLAVTAAATFVPARRASRLAPTSALRYD
jgi:ABC-type antimicrobial peptide transport system permease subunit